MLKWIPKIATVHGKPTQQILATAATTLPPALSSATTALSPVLSSATTALSPVLSSAALLCSQLLSQTPAPHKPLLLATEDLIRMHASQWITLNSPTLLSFTTPITIKRSPSTQTDKREPRTLGAARKNPTSPPSHTAPQLNPTPSEPLTLATAYKHPPQMIMQAVVYIIKRFFGLLEGPLWSAINYYLWARHNAKAQCMLPPALPIQSATSPDSPPLEEFSQSPQAFPPPGSFYSSTEHDPLPISATRPPTTQCVTHPIFSAEMNKGALMADTPTIIHTPSQCSKDDSAKSKTKSKRKGKIVPTRRSQRLQAKHQSNKTMSKQTPRARGQAKGIDFHLNTPETPLDIDTTLQILEATGLQINKQIEDAVQQAAQKDHPGDQITQISQLPTTPLHDPIPPLTIPGFDLPL